MIDFLLNAVLSITADKSFSPINRPPDKAIFLKISYLILKKTKLSLLLFHTQLFEQHPTLTKPRDTVSRGHNGRLT